MSAEYGPILCNLCWKEVQGPYIVTTCGHAFCMAHKDHPRIKEQTCPGCQRHLGSGGARVAMYEPESEADFELLCGMKLNFALKMFDKATKFWYVLHCSP